MPGPTRGGGLPPPNPPAPEMFWDFPVNKGLCKEDALVSREKESFWGRGTAAREGCCQDPLVGIFLTRLLIRISNGIQEH